MLILYKSRLDFLLLFYDVRLKILCGFLKLVIKYETTNVTQSTQSTYWHKILSFTFSASQLIKICGGRNNFSFSLELVGGKIEIIVEIVGVKNLPLAHIEAQCSWMQVSDEVVPGKAAFLYYLLFGRRTDTKKNL